MLQPTNIAMQSTVQRGKSALMHDYERLNHSFIALANRLDKEPVTVDNPVPPWKPDLQALSRLMHSNQSLSDYVVAANPKETEKLRDAYVKSTLLLEKEETKKLATNEYQALNRSFADKEAQISNMNRNSKALFVGSGPQPNTVLSYAKYAGSVKGIDIEQSAIDATKDIAKKSGGKISFEEANGHKFNYKGFTHIGIAVMVPSKGEILKQITNTADPGTTVIVRSVGGFKKAMYEGLEDASLKGFEKIATLHGSDFNITHALLLRKKGLSLLA